MHPVLVLSLLSPLSCVHASLHASIPEDLYAFPKYRVSFLNGLPVANETAERWLRDGLRGGEAEFLDQWHVAPLQSIESSDSTAAVGPRDVRRLSDHQSHDPASESSPALEHMRLGPSKSYVCLIPPAPTLPPPAPEENQTPVTPTHSWSLLQPLSGSCLYHRQAWFTYSYCHNLHVRQFRELPVTYPRPPGARVVEEDPEWESYTLGKSPASQSVDGELTVNDEIALANNLELARQGAGQRYLVQRWSDGTVCDMTGRPREIEVQFHCSMTMTDTILFVKETRTCEYVLVIHTPRLCGEPGFKSRLEQMPETAIRCREVVENVESVDPSLPEARHPFKRRPRPPIPAPPPAPPAPQQKADDETQTSSPLDTLRASVDRAQDTAKLLRQAIESLLGRGDIEDMAVFELQPGEEEGEYYVTLDAETQEALRGGDEPPGAGDGRESAPHAKGRGKTLEEALRAAGYDIRGQKEEEEGSGSEFGVSTQEGEEDDDQNAKQKREELRDVREPRDEL
ncbi:hypothetical protein K439DRAFT_1372269 [Ramaria rubella]|nr:hypothetical protein K439DRAFT_1372269 [Ramaria rubella]